MQDDNLISKLMKIGDRRVEEENNLKKRKRAAVDRIREAMGKFKETQALYSAYEHAVGEPNAKKPFNLGLDDISWCTCSQDGEMFSEKSLDGIAFYSLGKKMDPFAGRYDMAPNFLLADGTLYARYIEQRYHNPWLPRISMVKQDPETLDLADAERLANAFSQYPALLKAAVKDCISKNSELFPNNVCPL